MVAKLFQDGKDRFLEAERKEADLEDYWEGVTRPTNSNNILACIDRVVAQISE